MKKYNLAGLKKKPTWYYGITYCVLINHGEWSDGEVYYKGKIANEQDCWDTLAYAYKDECEYLGKEPQDWDSDDFMAFAKENGYLVKDFIQEFGEKSICRMICAYV